MQKCQLFWAFANAYLSGLSTLLPFFYVSKYFTLEKYIVYPLKSNECSRAGMQKWIIIGFWGKSLYTFEQIVCLGHKAKVPCIVYIDYLEAAYFPSNEEVKSQFLFPCASLLCQMLLSIKVMEKPLLTLIAQYTDEKKRGSNKMVTLLNLTSMAASGSTACCITLSDPMGMIKWKLSKPQGTIAEAGEFLLFLQTIYCTAMTSSPRLSFSRKI